MINLSVTDDIDGFPWRGFGVSLIAGLSCGRAVRVESVSSSILGSAEFP